MHSTIRVGYLIVQEHNMICPDAGKVWFVVGRYGNVVYHSRRKHDAINWAITHQQA
jgi:hypothetical protein